MKTARNSKRDLLLGALAAALVAAAVAYYLLQSRGQDVPTTEAATTLTCTNCKQRFELTTRQMDEQISARQAIRVGRGLLLFRCPSCGQSKARVGTSETADHEPPQGKSP